MKTYTLKLTYKKILADTTTPVSMYLKLRDKFPQTMLLESSDYHGNQDIYSYICCNPIAGIKIDKGAFTEYYPDGSTTSLDIEETKTVEEEPISLENNILYEAENSSMVTKLTNFIKGLFSK